MRYWWRKLSWTPFLGNGPKCNFWLSCQLYRLDLSLTGDIQAFLWPLGQRPQCTPRMAATLCLITVWGYDSKPRSSTLTLKLLLACRTWFEKLWRRLLGGSRCQSGFLRRFQCSRAFARCRPFAIRLCPGWRIGLCFYGICRLRTSACRHTSASLMFARTWLPSSWKFLVWGRKMLLWRRIPKFWRSNKCWLACWNELGQIDIFKAPPSAH